MKPLTIRLINKDLSDLYCYAGYFFFATDGGNVYSISLVSVFNELASKYVEYKNFLKIALINNDYLMNDQFEALIFGNIQTKFIIEWNKASKIIFEYSLDFSNCTSLGKVSGYPIYDMKAYGFYLFIGHGKGADYFKLNTNIAGEKIGRNKKIIDARIVNISAKIGQVLYSAGTDGLFTNSLSDDELIINKKTLADVSYKTNWSTWDFANYESNNKFVYFHNQIKKQEKRIFTYSNIDDEKTKNIISKIGVLQFSSSKLLKDESINYVINNNNYYYLFLKNGDIKIVNLINDEEETHFSSRTKNIYQNHRGNIISVKSGYESLMIETFDKLSILKNSKMQVLNNSQPLNYRSYLTSIRLRKTITASYDGYSDMYLCL